MLQALEAAHWPRESGDVVVEWVHEEDEVEGECVGRGQCVGGWREEDGEKLGEVDMWQANFDRMLVVLDWFVVGSALCIETFIGLWRDASPLRPGVCSWVASRLEDVEREEGRMCRRGLQAGCGRCGCVSV